MSDVAQVVLGALAATLGVLIFIFRHPLGRFTHQMNSERTIARGETPPWRYSPVWVGFIGSLFVVIGVVISISGVVKLVNS